MALGSNLCIDNIWNGSLFQYRKYPIFTNCFQYSILLISPTIFVVMTLSFLLLKLFRNKRIKKEVIHSFDLRHSIKTILPIICAILLTVEMTLEFKVHEKNDALMFISYGVMLFSLITIPVIMELRRFGNYSIDIISFIFWWLMTGSYVVKLYGSLIQYGQGSMGYDVSSLILSCTILFVLQVSTVYDSFPRFSLRLMKTTNPERTSSSLSRFTFSWMDIYIYRWFKKELTNETVFNLNLTEESQKNTELIEDIFFERLKQNPDSEKSFVSSETSLLADNYAKSQMTGMILFKSLYQAYFRLILISWTLKILRDILILTLPFMLKFLLDYIQKKENNNWTGILFAFIFFFQGLLGNIFENYCFAILNKISIRVRGAVIGMVYRKTLRLMVNMKNVYTSGDIVNLTSVDIEQIMNWIVYSWILVSCPLQIALSIVLLYLQLGFAIFGGVFVLAALIPLNAVIMKVTRKFSTSELQWKDKRINVLSEIVSGIKVIKMYTWEKCFSSKIKKLRNFELRNIRNISIGWCIISVMWDLVPFLVMYISFMIYIHFVPHHILNAEKIFVSLILFNNLQLPTILFPWCLSQTITAFVSFKRIADFLCTPERTTYVLRSPLCDTRHIIEIENGYFLWSENDRAVLKNINLKIEKQKLIAVVGKVGVGKSSLLSAILGEMHRLSGTVKVKGTTAYVSQEAWLQNNSIKNNILFQKAYNESFYENIITACCLNVDIDTFSMKDGTEIGERGIKLSGGQKQRISLARAIYQDCDIYLLDDPLSSVDVNIGQQLFNNIISNDGMLKYKTRILVTHGIKWLPFVDEIIVIDSYGYISDVGNYQSLLITSEEFKVLLKEAHQDSESIQSRIEADSRVDISFNDTSESVKDDINLQSGTHQEPNIEMTKEDEVNEEEVMSGEVSIKSLYWYFKARGMLIFTISTFACLIFGTLQAFGNVWLGKLSEIQSSDNISSYGNNESRLEFYLNYYGVIGLGQLIMVIIFWGGFTYGSLKASKKIHRMLLNSILRSPLSFFDATSSGRIINRFTKDLNIIDHVLNLNITDIINRMVLLIVSLLVITYVTPWFGFIGVLIFVAYLILQKFYISSSRQSRRLDAKMSSFVFSYIMESCNGASIIRAFKAENEFEKIQFQYVDQSNKFKFIQYFCIRWLSLRLNLLGGLIVFGSVLFAIFSRSYLTAGLVGLSISYALQVTGIIYWLSLQYSEFETNSVAIERIREYTMIPIEAPWYVDKNLVKNWIWQGNIGFHNFSMQYKINSRLVLRNINLQIHGGEKIGIIGRTGAGKSSLSLAIFRLVESCTGNIFIDGINIHTIGLHQLRKQLAIIPQDPTIFTGTLRENIDPFEEYSDKTLNKCLKLSGLEEWITSLPDKLNHDCGSMGINLSVGQKQLICLTRAMLRKSKIIILDEATASVDLETERKVMDAIKSQFSESTVLIIAHKISTVMNCDKILVLDSGAVVEYDSVKELTTRADGIFHSMVLKDLYVKNK